MQLFNAKKLFLFIIFTLVFSQIFSQQSVQKTQNGSVESKSTINWISRDFVSNLSLDAEKLQVQLPSGKKIASKHINSKMPQLIQQPLLSLFADSESTLSDQVINGNISLDNIFAFITSGYKTQDIFSHDLKTLNSTNTTNVNNIGKLLVKHDYAFKPEQPIDVVSTRAFSGIIIDARGALHVHGEYISDDTYPCFFPKIWDDQMNVIFEKNSVNPDFVKNNGLVKYHYSNNLADYEDRVGLDPLYIKAREVFGRNRTDPIISREDALKILADQKNIELLTQGKVVILLDKENLIYDIAVPEKDKNYYVHYNDVKNYFYENKVPDVIVSDTINGILFSVNLNFIPDSPELLPSEEPRIKAIADNLKNILLDNGYTILVEGHTADVGKPVGQLNLSIERTRTVMNALIDHGIDESLFTYKGYGGTMPIATNATEEGRAQNRRVDITARPRATYIQRDWN